MAAQGSKGGGRLSLEEVIPAERCDSAIRSLASNVTATRVKIWPLQDCKSSTLK